MNPVDPTHANTGAIRIGGELIAEANAALANAQARTGRPVVYRPGVWLEEKGRWMWVSPALAKVLHGQGAVEGQPWTFPDRGTMAWKVARQPPTPLEARNAGQPLIPPMPPNRAQRRAIKSLVRKAGRA